MPTALPRHAITETAEISAQLDAAAKRWPTVGRADLIRFVLEDWVASRRREAARQRLVGSSPGTSDAYDRDADWPE